MPIKLLVLGGVLGVLGGGGQCRFYFYGRGDFSENWWCLHYFLPKGGHTFAKVPRQKSPEIQKLDLFAMGPVQFSNRSRAETI